MVSLLAYLDCTDMHHHRGMLEVVMVTCHVMCYCSVDVTPRYGRSQVT